MILWFVAGVIFFHLLLILCFIPFLAILPSYVILSLIAGYRSAR